VGCDVVLPAVGGKRCGKFWLVFFANKCSAGRGMMGWLVRANIFIYMYRAVKAEVKMNWKGPSEVRRRYCF
jgi:hypothetical protein